MNVDFIQLLCCIGFAVLGWWLRHQGIPWQPAPASTRPAPPQATAPTDQKMLIDLLKSVLDRLSQAQNNPSTPTAPTTVLHLPIEVAANVKQPTA